MKPILRVIEQGSKKMNIRKLSVPHLSKNFHRYKSFLSHVTKISGE